MESLTENKALLYSILGSGGGILALALGIIPQMAYEFEIVNIPTEVFIHILNINIFKNLYKQLGLDLLIIISQTDIKI